MHIHGMHGEDAMAPAQIDYILVSKRWKSSVKQCSVSWEPSYHRFGYRYDHGMVRMRWKQRLKRLTPKTEKPDFESFYYGDQHIARFDKAVEFYLKQYRVPPEYRVHDPSTLAEDYAVMTDAIQAGVDLLLPKDKKRGKVRTRSERTKALFEERKLQCSKLVRGTSSPEWIAMHRSFRKRICSSCREDYRTYISSQVSDIRNAEVAGRSQDIARGVRALRGSSSYGSQKRPSRDSKTGEVYWGPEELAAAWAEFAKEKFSATPREACRGDMPDLGPSSSREDDVPQDEHLEECLKALSSSKAAGRDGIPVEVYKASLAAKRELFAMVKRIWKQEEVPEEMVLGIFCPLYKKKDADDMENYRFICLLPHAYKLLSVYLLRRMLEEAGGFLPDYQAGFRAGRGCRDNVFILTLLLDAVLEIGSSCVLTFIDFKAAFDSISHFFLDSTLGEAGVGAKCRSIFRAIYINAAGCVRVRAADGTELYSITFPIRRGVLQGDIFSPFGFIAAFALVMKRHDPGGGVSALGQMVIELLGYADDAILADNTTSGASSRITSICMGALEDADMVISEAKTVVMHVARPEAVTPIKEEDIDRFTKEGKFGFKCSHCSRPFPTKHGKKIHEARWCPVITRGIYDRVYDVKKIVDARGSPRSRFYLVWWDGFKKKESTWEPERHLEGAKDAVAVFWAGHPKYKIEETIEVEGEHRCKWCCKFSSTLRGHNLHCNKCSEKPRVHSKGGKLIKVATRLKRANLVRQKARVKMGDKELKNVFDETYLGHFIQADGDSIRAVEVRIGKAWTKFTQLRHIWDSSTISRWTKLQLYQSGVLSTLCHCHEVWCLTKKVRSMVGGFNAKCLSIITGKSIREERVHPSVDLVLLLRVRRLRWLGHILRMDSDRILKQALLSLQQPYPEGSLLMDAPPHESWDDLMRMAGCENRDGGHGVANHKEWNEMIRKFEREYIELI